MSANSTTRSSTQRIPKGRRAPSDNEKAAPQTSIFEPADPSKVFRVEIKPILYFQQLTTISTYTHVSGSPTQVSTKIQHQNRTQPPPRLAAKNPGPAMEDIHNSCDS